MDRASSATKSSWTNSATSGASVKNAVLVHARREALVRAAVDLFCDKGYHLSRIIDVANAAGVSHGTIYNYVSCKEDLLYLICEDHFRGYEQIVAAAIEKATSPRQRLDALLRATIDVIFKYRKHYIVMLRELHHVESSKRRAFFSLAAEQRKFVQSVLKDVAKHEPILIDDPLVTANILVYLPKMVVSRGWDLRGKIDDETVAQMLLAFMRRGLGLGPQKQGARKRNAHSGLNAGHPRRSARGTR
jgi:AcrR family transcriptional regulator